MSGLLRDVLESAVATHCGLTSLSRLIHFIATFLSSPSGNDATKAKEASLDPAGAMANHGDSPGIGSPGCLLKACETGRNTGDVSGPVWFRMVQDNPCASWHTVYYLIGG